MQSHSGHSYFLTLVDDCSRFRWFFMMKYKAGVHFLIPRFCAMVHTQFRKVIKSFRSDNARELFFADFFSKQGTLHQFFCIEFPQKNSVVERKH